MACKRDASSKSTFNFNTKVRPAFVHGLLAVELFRSSLVWRVVELLEHLRGMKALLLADKPIGTVYNSGTVDSTL